MGDRNMATLVFLLVATKRFHEPGKLKLWLVGCRKKQPHLSWWSTVGPNRINEGNTEWGVSSTCWKVRLYCYLPQWIIFITHYANFRNQYQSRAILEKKMCLSHKRNITMMRIIWLSTGEKFLSSHILVPGKKKDQRLHCLLCQIFPREMSKKLLKYLYLLLFTI